MHSAATMPVIDLLSAWGPGCEPAIQLADSDRYCRALTIEHGENFSVLSRFVPERMFEGMCAIYAYCRWSDDLADEAGDPARATELLSWWRGELEACFAGTATHPVFVSLTPVIDRHGLTAEPFHALLDAFQSDQLVDRYDDWDQLLAYCRGSADPVGRLVLALADEPCTAEQLHASDAICTALQLTNHWQDVKRDLLERDRIYLPSALHRIPDFDQRLLRTARDGHAPDATFLTDYRALVKDCVERTWSLFEEGRALLPSVSPELRPILWLFQAGGTSVLRRIEQWNYETCLDRPRLGRLAKLLLVLRAGRASRIDSA